MTEQIECQDCKKMIDIKRDEHDNIIFDDCPHCQKEEPRKCYLCGGETVNKYCINKSCAVYNRAK